MLTDTARKQLEGLATELIALTGAMANLDGQILSLLNPRTLDSNAAHLAAVHAELSAKRAALIAAFFREV